MWEMLTGAHLSAEATLLRILVGALAGAVIGLEREWSRQTAGLRTHVLISMGSTLLMTLSIFMAQEFFGGPGAQAGDPGRIAAQVVSGIGFLGAGAFIRIGSDMKGVTTAASIWVVAAIGLAIGAGMFVPAMGAVALAFLALTALERVERRFFPSARYKNLKIEYEAGTPDRDKLERILSAYKISIQTYDAHQIITKKTTRLTLLLKVPSTLDVERMFKEIRATGTVTRIKLEENF